MSQTINLPHLHCQKCVETENISHTENTSVLCCELDLDQRAIMKRWLLKWYTVRSGKTITIRELLVKLLEQLRQKLPLYFFIFFCHLPVSNIVSTCWPTVEKSAIRRQRLDLFMKKKFEFTLTSTSAAWDLDFRDLLSSKDKNLGGESTSTSLLCLVCTILPQFLLMPLRTVSPVSVQPKDCFVLLPPLKI